MPNFLGTTLPKRWTGFHDESTVLVGVALTTTNDTGQQAHYFYSEIGSSGTAATGDTWTHSLWVRAGTYTLSITYVKKTTCGKLDLYLDNVAIQAGFDLYNGGGTTYNNVLTISSLVIGTDGLHVLKGVTNGKNAGSTGYEITLTEFDLYQATD